MFKVAVIYLTLLSIWARLYIYAYIFTKPIFQMQFIIFQTEGLLKRKRQSTDN